MLFLLRIFNAQIVILLLFIGLVWYAFWLHDYWEKSKYQEYLHDVDMKLEVARVDPNIEIYADINIHRYRKNEVIYGGMNISIIPINYEQILSKLKMDPDYSNSTDKVWVIEFYKEDLLFIHYDNSKCYYYDDCSFRVIFDDDPSSTISISPSDFSRGYQQNYYTLSASDTSNSIYSALREKFFNSKKATLYIDIKNSKSPIKIEYITDALFDFDEMQSAMREHLSSRFDFMIE